MKTEFIELLQKVKYIETDEIIPNESEFLSKLQQIIREKYFLHPYVVPTGDCITWSFSNLGYTNKNNRNRIKTNTIKKFSQFNESNRVKITLGDNDVWLDLEKQMIFDSEFYKNGIYFDISGEGDNIAILSKNLKQKRKSN